MLPGTFEYAERTANRPEVKFYWYYANQPIVNVFNRHDPYYWVFDPLLTPDEWVRQPPAFAIKHPHMNIDKLCTPENFPPDEGKDLIVVIGIRANESMNRALSINSSKGYLTKIQPSGYKKVRPIYDWGAGDVWLAYKENQWDYNSAYDVMVKYGLSASRQRIAPPFITTAGIDVIQMCAKAFPKWWVKVCERLPGAKSAGYFGRRSVKPIRQLGESWADCYQRTCIDEAPKWIADRSIKAKDVLLAIHEKHSSSPLPEKGRCLRCRLIGSWERMTSKMYGGDPFCMAGIPGMPYVEPEFFRPGTGTWGGKPQW